MLRVFAPHHYMLLSVQQYERTIKMRNGEKENE